MPPHLYWVGLLIAFVGQYGAAGAAAPELPTQRHPSAAARIVEPLMPDHKSLVHFSSVALEKDADGRRTLTVIVKTDGRRSAHMYYIMADTLAGTYRAFPVRGYPFRDPHVRAYLREIRNRLEQEEQWNGYERLMAHTPREETTLEGLLASFDYQESPPVCVYCPPDQLCSGTAFTRTKTWDPVWISLTETDHTLRWSRDDSPTGCRWNASQSRRCWAANPTFFGTHWFVDSCVSVPLQKSEMYAEGMTDGAFHNDDFLLPSQRTWIRAAALTKFNGGVVTHGYQFLALGEASSLLGGGIVGASSSGTCR